ncbi:unnamed protein product [Heterobilharzia americana]|nr:unnamed protein product [Heterobilharzia americana]
MFLSQDLTPQVNCRFCAVELGVGLLEKHPLGEVTAYDEMLVRIVDRIFDRLRYVSGLCGNLE